MYAIAYRAAIRLEHPREHLQKRRLPCSIRPNERYFLATIERQVEPLVDDLRSERLIHRFGRDHFIARSRRLLEAELHFLAFIRHLDDLHALDLLHAILNLLGFRSLIAETLDEGLHMRDLFGLLGSLFPQELQALFALGQVTRIVAGIERYLP